MSESMFEKTFWLKMKFRSIPPPNTIYYHKYYKTAKSLISLKPLNLQGRLTPQSLDKNRVSRGLDTNRGPIHLWVFIHSEESSLLQWLQKSHASG